MRRLQLTEEERLARLRAQQRAARERLKAKNPHYSRDATRRMREKDPEAAKAKSKRYYEENQVQIRERVKLRAAANKVKVREQARRSYEKHKLKHLASAKAWQEANPEKVLEAKRKWRRNNAEKQRVATARWAKNHPAEVLVKSGRHRAKKFSAKGRYTIDQLNARILYYGGLCAYCRVTPCEGIDHVIPLTRGGSNWPANLRPVCAPCNSSKGNRLLSEWKGPPREQKPRQPKPLKISPTKLPFSWRRSFVAGDAHVQQQ